MMKRIAVLLLSISTLLCLASLPSRAQQSRSNPPRVPTKNNTLIVYLSRTNNTRPSRKSFIKRSAAHLSLWNWKRPIPLTTGPRCNKSSTRMRPLSAPLRTKIDRIEQYEFVFLAFRLGECNCRHQSRASCTNTT